jgi:hypothetical protein
MTVRRHKVVLASFFFSLTLLCMMVPLAPAQMDPPEVIEERQVCLICNEFKSASLSGLNIHASKCRKKNSHRATGSSAGGGNAGSAPVSEFNMIFKR